MYLTSAQRVSSGITAPHGAIIAEPPFDAAPLEMTSKMSWLLPPYLKSPLRKSRGGGLSVLPTGPWPSPLPGC